MWKYVFVLSGLLLIAAVGTNSNTLSPTRAEPTPPHASSTSDSTTTAVRATSSVPVSQKPKSNTPPKQQPKETASVPSPKPSTGVATTSVNTKSTTSAQTQTPPVASSPIPVATSTATTPTSTPPTLDITTAIELKAHALINIERNNYGLSSLSYDATLSGMARAHSADMLALDYFSHTSKRGCDMSCRFKDIGYTYWAIGENIYTMYGFPISVESSAQKIVQGWMDSPGHRANILNSTYTDQGIGIAIRGTTVYATEDLAKPR